MNPDRLVQRGAALAPRTMEMMVETVGSAIDPVRFEALKAVVADETRLA